MATKFMRMPQIGEVKEPKKTVFEKYLSSNFAIEKARLQPDNNKNVMFVRHDVIYGDVFIAWNDDPNNFEITFGTAGDEFNQ